MNVAPPPQTLEPDLAAVSLPPRASRPERSGEGSVVAPVSVTDAGNRRVATSRRSALVRSSSGSPTIAISTGLVTRRSMAPSRWAKPFGCDAPACASIRTISTAVSSHCGSPVSAPSRNNPLAASEFADGVAAQQVLLRQCDAEAVLDRHHAHGECHRVEADVVDETGVGGDAADVDVHVVAQDFAECDADLFGC